MFKMAQIFRIDNQIVEMVGTASRISPIKLFERQHQVILNLDVMPYVTTGTRRLDSLLIQRIMNGTEKYEDLNIVYPDNSIPLV
jgi:hypothetical protein